MVYRYVFILFIQLNKNLFLQQPPLSLTYDDGYLPFSADEIYDIKESLVYSTRDFYDLYQAQPRDEDEWKIMEMRYQKAEMYDTIAAEYWNAIKHNIYYFQTIYNMYKSRKRRCE